MLLALFTAQALSPRMPDALDQYFKFIESEPAVVVRWKESGTGPGSKSQSDSTSKRLWLTKDGRIRLDLGTVARTWDGKQGLEWNRDLKTWKRVGRESLAGEAMMVYGLTRPVKVVEANKWGYAQQGDVIQLQWVLGIDAATTLQWDLAKNPHRLVRLIREDITIAGPVKRKYEILSFRRLRTVASSLFSTEPPKGFEREVPKRP